VVQLRTKHAGDRAALAMGREVRELTRARGVLFFVNDRFDLALAVGADGVHLGQDDLHPDDLPADARARLLVGRSTHTLAQVRAAANEPIDYVAFGPIFGTVSKASPYPARELPLLREAVREASPRPVVAIGGIDVDNAGAVAGAGAAGAAVISAVANADDTTQAVRALVHAFLGSRSE
jgi:thiamine-phosphate pyrophosphorylase